MKAVILLLLRTAYVAAGSENLYEAYHDEGFISFVEQRNLNDSGKIIWEIFQNLGLTNSTDFCVRDLKTYQNSVISHEKWATVFLDSSGGPETGLLSGNTISLGDYKQCMSYSSWNFSSAYCLVNLMISKNEKKNAPWAPHNVPIVFSLCVPSTCHSGQLESLLEPTMSIKNESVTVECQYKRPGFSFADCFIISIFILIWIMIICTTIPKEWMPINHKGLLMVWESLNLQKNLFFMLKTTYRVNLLSSLHGLRVLSQCLIVWYHVIYNEQSINYPVLNKFYFIKFFSSWKGAIETQLVLAVDTFFVIGGILLTWNCLEKKKNFNLIEYYAHRYLRLTPPYLATLIIVSTFANKLCDGPLCYYMIDKEKKSCENYWWSNLLYINNIYPGIMKSCMPHSWYLAADWQLFFFLSPFVVIIINKWPQHLLKFVSAIFITSVASTFMVSNFYQLSTESLIHSSYEEARQYYNKLYTTPFTRAGPWAIGLFFGAVLHNFKNNPVKISKNFQFLAWLFTILGLCLSVELDLPFLKLMQSASGRGFWSALFNGIHRNIWAICICWIVFSSGTQKAGFVGKFLCWSVFQPLAKLSYSAYLIHKLIISLYFGETSGYNYISTTTQIPLVLGFIFLSYLAGLLLYLSFEAPTVHLEKIIFQKATSSAPATDTGESNPAEPENGTMNRNNGHVMEPFHENQT